MAEVAVTLEGTENSKEQENAKEWWEEDSRILRKNIQQMTTKCYSEMKDHE